MSTVLTTVRADDRAWDHVADWLDAASVEGLELALSGGIPTELPRRVAVLAHRGAFRLPDLARDELVRRALRRAFVHRSQA